MFRGGGGLMVLKKCDDFVVVVKAKPLIIIILRDATTIKLYIHISINSIILCNKH